MHVACAAPRARALGQSRGAREVDCSWQMAAASLRNICVISIVRSRLCTDISMWFLVTIRMGQLLSEKLTQEHKCERNEGAYGTRNGCKSRSIKASES
jgi:hypothetical protein